MTALEMFVWKMGPSTIQWRGQCNLVLELLMTKLLLQLRREVQRHEEGKKTREAPRKYAFNFTCCGSRMQLSVSRRNCQLDQKAGWDARGW